MDPFLEHPAYWLDFHSRFINCWCEPIAAGLPPQYEASLGERVYLIEHDPEARKLGYPDLAVTIPLTILEGQREASIDGRLSPTNRAGPN
jgi:hypothetical protein